MRFGPSFLERLRSHFLLSEVIGKRIPIKRHGREFQGLCPFHSEKTPSFTVNDEKGFYHCFGCAAHGDAIKFIEVYERLTWPEAVEKLAREAGIPLPEPTREESQRYEREKTLHGVLEASAAWFEQQLASVNGASARDYLEKRGLRHETLRKYRIGYAPDERTGLHQHLNKAGFSRALQAEAGMIIIPDSGEPYDRFRGRVTFPIRNAKGKIIAFGGRLIGSGSGNRHLPKYLNSPETPLFKKGEMLFNLDLAKAAAREHNMIVVMEGYMDVVSTAQAGVAYAVATLGTAVTPEHLRLLWQLAGEPVMCLDGDAAGKRAMMRAAEIALPLLKPGVGVRFAVLPRGEDPDSYIQKHGRASFERILAASKRLSQVIWETLLPQYNLDLPEGRAALEDACRKLAAKIADPTVRQHYVSYFRKQLWDKTGKPAKPEQTRSHHVEQMVVAHHSAALETLARRLLKTLLQFPALLHKSDVEETLSHLSIQTARLDALRNAMLAGHDPADLDDRAAFLARLQARLEDDVIDHAMKEPLNLPWRDTLALEDAMQLWNETVAAYEYARLKAEYQELERDLAQELDDTKYIRFIEVQQAIKKADAGRNFAPSESDVA